MSCVTLDHHACEPMELEKIGDIASTHQHENCHKNLLDTTFF